MRTRKFTVSVVERDDMILRTFLKNSGYAFESAGSNKYGNQYRIFGDKTAEKEVRECLRRRQFS